MQREIEIEKIVNTGRNLIGLRAISPRGTFLLAARERYDLDYEQIRKYMRIAEHPVLSDRKRWSYLPLSFEALYHLSRVMPGALDRLIYRRQVDETSSVLECERFAQQFPTLKRASRRPRADPDPDAEIKRLRARVQELEEQLERAREAVS